MGETNFSSSRSPRCSLQWSHSEVLTKAFHKTTYSMKTSQTLLYKSKERHEVIEGNSLWKMCLNCISYSRTFCLWATQLQTLAKQCKTSGRNSLQPMNPEAKLRVIQAKLRVWFQWGKTQNNQKEKQGKDTNKRYQDKLSCHINRWNLW